MIQPSPLPADGGTGPGDLLLVKRALRGEPDATDRVLARLGCTVRFVYRLNRTLGYGLPPDALEDVVQQVYLAVWPRLGDFAGSAALESWVYGFCRNCLRAEARRRANSLRAVAVQGDLDGLERPADEVAPEDASVRAEGTDALHAELEQLPPAEREVVRLRHLEGFSFEDIARHQQLPPSTVKDRCYRAMQRLKARLKRRDVSA